VRNKGRLYYRPKSKDFMKQEIVAPALDRVIELRGDKDHPVHHIHVEGFTFCDVGYTAPERLKDTYFPDDAAVWLWAAQRCRIAGNTFRDVGGYGVMLRDASTHNEIIGNEVTGAGQGGVYLNGFTEETRKAAPDGQRPAHNAVTDNYIHHCGWFYVHVAGVYLACADDNLIAQNEIHDMTRYGISLKQACQRNVIEYNEVRRTNLATRDTGAIEMADNKEGGIVRFNLVADSIGCGFNSKTGKQQCPEDSCGIYLDNMSSKVHVYGNVVFRNAGGLWLNWGNDNLIENNIFVEGRDRQVVFNRWSDPKKWDTKGNRFLRNILCYTDAQAALFQVGSWDQKTEAVLSDCNLIHAPGNAPTVQGIKADDAWAKWRESGQDTHSILADPGFVAPKKGDYRLKPDSPAFQLGFQPIPFEKIGRRKR
jgi:parallel beta-helix repeat protein